MVIVQNTNGNMIGAASWTTGFVTKRVPQQDLREEARKNLLAVVNRLLRAGRDDEAEKLFDEFA